MVDVLCNSPLTASAGDNIYLSASVLSDDFSSEMQDNGWNSIQDSNNSEKIHCLTCGDMNYGCTMNDSIFHGTSLSDLISLRGENVIGEDSEYSNPFSEERNITFDGGHIGKNVGIAEIYTKYEDLNKLNGFGHSISTLKTGDDGGGMMSLKPIGKSEISFGNMYDGRSAEFIKDCQNLNIELPSSVTHHGSYVDRSYNGGLMEIDKSLIRTSLKEAVDKGQISQNEFERLNNKLTSC